MSQMTPEMMQMLMQDGSAGMAAGPAEDPYGQSAAQAEPKDGDWLAEAINAVHAGMVQEPDAKQVSLLGEIMNKLTTFQANAANAAPQNPGG
jgi:hypothetical protein